MLLRALTPRETALRLSAWVGALLCAACPQLLADDFDLIPEPDALGSGGGGGALGGSAGIAGSLGGSGATGAGGSQSGAGGDAMLVDAGAGGNDALGGAGPTAGAGGGAGSAGASADSGGGGGPVTVLGEALLHRYSFDGSGSVITDSAGTADGAAIGASIAASSGKVNLSGIDQYINLPNGLISGLSSVTLEAWVNWLADPSTTAANWQTLFSFGANAGGEDAQGNGTTYVYLTAKSGDSGDIRAGYTLGGFNEELFVDGERALPQSANATLGTQVAFVIDSAQDRLSIYIDGTLEVSVAAGTSIELSSISDVNNWLGRSQYATDPEFSGDILEFRIYGSALSASDLQLSFELGPDGEL